jgi:hypothetical protein
LSASVPSLRTYLPPATPAVYDTKARYACCCRRFPGRTHHVWLEPEALETDVVYPNGISNSMEPEDQIRLLRTIPGAPPSCVGVWVESLRTSPVGSSGGLGCYGINVRCVRRLQNLIESIPKATWPAQGKSTAKGEEEAKGMKTSEKGPVLAI